ncbi:hypothetical protein [Massilia putida]|uniref:hypothetical protein n=1 Tax=Massilia putida TaxID=1141883 RepID=UPI0009F84C74|nr:hypothetical protein [Massilia putida]
MGIARFDVFNGDADGICAQHQWRLAHPGESTLVTGVKRDVALLERIACGAGAEVTVFDIAIDANAAPLRRLLDAGAHVTWFDHHSARQAFAHPRLCVYWDDAPTVCTSLLVDRHLAGRYRPWAIAAAFGDNLAGPARSLAQAMGWCEAQIAAIAELGTVLNYNAYGECVDDLHLAPDALYLALRPYADPFEFIDASDQYRMLVEGYRDDAARMDDLRPYAQWPCGAVYVLPDACWSRRVSGTFANRLAATGGESAFAVLTPCPDGTYVVSVRSGEPATHAAHVLCERFAGGGRRAAAGINRLPAADVDRFVHAFADYFAGCGRRAHAG